MESVVIDMCEGEDLDIVDEEELELATRGGRLLRDPSEQVSRDEFE